MNSEYPTPASPIVPAFQRLRLRLRRMAGAMLGSEEDADDALQDAFCRLWTRREPIGSEDEAAALLTATVRHIGIDRLRRRRQAVALRLDEADAESLSDEADEQARRDEQFRRVEALIACRLSPLAREILERRDFRGETLEAIAASLGMQPTAVRMQLSRARKTIRTCYREENNLP